jgi:hypothetical protein
MATASEGNKGDFSEIPSSIQRPSMDHPISFAQMVMITLASDEC